MSQIVLPPIIADAALAYSDAVDAADNLALAGAPLPAQDAAAADLRALCEEITDALVDLVEQHTYPTV